MSFDRTRLITPPKEEEEIYPYRRVWFSRIIEGVLLIALCAGFYIATLLGIQIPETLKIPVNIAIALSPALLWLIFSQIPETRVPQPRYRLLQVFIFAALLTGAVGLPVLELILQPTAWLTEQDTFTRIQAYMLTTGIVLIFLMYLTLRYTIFPHEYRNRMDAIAYGAAAAIAAATVFNSYYVLTLPDALPHIVALRTLHNTVILLSGSLLLSYGLVQTAFQRATALMLPITTLLASFVIGLGITLRAGIISGGLGLEGGSTREYLGLAFAIVFFVVGMSLMLFLYRIADNRDRDILRG